ncbi:MAG: methylase, partial [Oscillospiraceae bacterium]|nr:methylase [Oscillospiraceae bacterium]
MTDARQRAAAKHFAEFWKGKGYEKGESQPFWLTLLGEVYGVEHPAEFITFEDQVHLDHTSFIDGYIPSTRVLIEQKSRKHTNLNKPIPQSSGPPLSPFQQAKRYITELPVSKHPRWVVTCNFISFYVYDMERPGGEPEEILLENLPTEYYRLAFLADMGNTHLKREMEVSIQAGEIVGRLYDAFLKQYVGNPTEAELKSLNVLCVRLVFCLYAEDAGIFGRRGVFHDYLGGYETRHTRKALLELFQVLNTPEEERDPYLEEDLAQFPYVNGGLFEDNRIIIPQFTDEIRNLLLHKASEGFDWAQISPTIFGAVFESTLNPQTRRAGGMHYTSIENIRKVIDPLFLNDLEKELEDICAVAVTRTKEKRLKDFQAKLASLTFLDPACGSGNFLTETYLSLRRLENTALSELQNGQIMFGVGGLNPIQVSIGQFYGIEINDFAVTVAKTALWIAESQMMKATEDIVHAPLDFLPLRSYANIVEGNALRLNWDDVAPKEKLCYIMGNPPFVGKKEQTALQKAELMATFGNQKGVGILDYVTGWYKKAAEYMRGTAIRAAFVSTNSISQGEQPAVLWKALLNDVKIDFAWRTFIWNSEAKDKAHVHCVIIGFSMRYVSTTKRVFSD